MECLKKGGMAVLEWVVRLVNLSFDMGVVPMDWRGACMVPLYKGNGDKCECSNSRGISLLSVVGTLFGRVLIKRVRAGTESAYRSTWYVADAKSVWSWRKIVESSAEFLCR